MLMTTSGLRLVLLRIHDTVLLDFRFMLVVHSRYVFEDRGRSGAGEALDDVCEDLLAVASSECFHARHSSNIQLLGDCVASRRKLLTILVRNCALRINNSLLGRLNDAVGRVVGPAHYDRFLGCNSHGQSSKERDKKGSKCKAHAFGCSSENVGWRCISAVAAEASLSVGTCKVSE